ncbi:MAG: CdaR family protein [Lachnospiraceae bacterium]|nr:CdaR family protein [Lachnospiraceae bacterium]MDD7436111.1 CdaR family protein [Lachnospiraceae bacterium]MDY3341453.1 CdaR family protein [Lachnospiraceae bacterium]
MKHKWTNNLGLKIVSLLVSCLIWVVVTNTNDPESTQVYKNVPITIKNQDTITNANKTFTVVDGVDKINVYVTARKSVRSSLAADSFIVKADMENYNEALGTVPLEISCEDGRIRQEDIRMLPSSLKISMEDKVEQNFGMAVVTTGKPDKGYEVGKTTIVTGDTIRIAGPESLINIIGKVTISVDVTNMSMGSTDFYPIRIEDKNGATLTDGQMSNLELKNSDGVSLQNNSAEVRTELWKVYNDIPLKVEVTGEVAPGYKVSAVTLAPQTINLVAEENAIEELGGIIQLKDPVNVEGMTETQDFTVDLNDTLNQYDDIRLESDISSAITVHVGIDEVGSKTFQMPISDIIMHNTPSDKKLIFSPADAVSISVKTTSEDSEEAITLTLSDISAEIDLKSCEINGSYTLPVNVTLPEGYELVNDVSIVVNIEEQDNEAEIEANTEG